MNQNLGGENSAVPGDSPQNAGLPLPADFQARLLGDFTLNDQDPLNMISLSDFLSGADSLGTNSLGATAEQSGNIGTRGKKLSATSAERSKKYRERINKERQEMESKIQGLTAEKTELKANQDYLQSENSRLNEDVAKLKETVGVLRYKLRKNAAGEGSLMALVEHQLLMEPGSPENRIAALEKENENLVNENKELRDENELLLQLYTLKKKHKQG